jgi:hypothetical protein
MSKPFPLVILESPYKARDGDDPVIGLETNFNYRQACIQDCLSRGESPYASHQMLAQALSDEDPGDRELGITAGFAWHWVAAYMVVYRDRGVSGGMWRGIEHAQAIGLRFVYRGLGGVWVDTGMRG